MRFGIFSVGAIAGLLLAGDAQAAPIKSEVIKTSIRRGVDVKPLPRDKAPRTHAPYESGQCAVCHVNNDPAKPGPIRHASVNEQCFECHDDVRDIMARKYRHVPAKEACTHCHNPHNSSQPALLALDTVSLCVKCHAGIKNQLAKGRVQHDAITKDKKCGNCHNPHASKQAHHIRDGVPYGAKGWVLKIGYTKLPTGGQCAKTCHDTKAYNNKTLTSSAPKK